MKLIIFVLAIILIGCQGQRGERGPTGPQSGPDTVFIVDTVKDFSGRIDTVFYYDTVFNETTILIDTVFVDSFSSLLAFDSSGIVPAAQNDTTFSGSKYWLIRFPSLIKTGSVKSISLWLQYGTSTSWSCAAAFDYHLATNSISLQTTAKKFIIHIIYSRQ